MSSSAALGIGQFGGFGRTLNTVDELRIATTFIDALPELPLPGDTDGDRDVDLDDYNNIISNLNAAGRYGHFRATWRKPMARRGRTAESRSPTTEFGRTTIRRYLRVQVAARWRAERSRTGELVADADGGHCSPPAVVIDEIARRSDYLLALVDRRGHVHGISIRPGAMFCDGRLRHSGGDRCGDNLERSSSTAWQFLEASPPRVTVECDHQGYHGIPGEDAMSKQVKGFTLVELLVVIAIIGILVALLVARHSGRPRSGSAHAVQGQPQEHRPGHPEPRRFEEGIPDRRRHLGREDRGLHRRPPTQTATSQTASSWKPKGWAWAGAFKSCPTWKNKRSTIITSSDSDARHGSASLQLSVAAQCRRKGVTTQRRADRLRQRPAMHENGESKPGATGRCCDRISRLGAVGATSTRAPVTGGGAGQIPNWYTLGLRHSPTASTTA